MRQQGQFVVGGLVVYNPTANFIALYLLYLTQLVFYAINVRRKLVNDTKLSKRHNTFGEFLNFYQGLMTIMALHGKLILVNTGPCFTYIKVEVFLGWQKN